MAHRISVGTVFRDVGGKPFNSDIKAVRKLNRMIAAADHLDVSLPISNLFATQASVNSDFATASERYVGEMDALPAVVKYRGRYYVTDGHHRLMEAANKGLAVANVRLFDLDGDTQLDFPILDYIQGTVDAPNVDDEQCLKLGC